MFGFFKKKPKEVVCYPEEYHVVVALSGGKDIEVLEGYGDAALKKALEFMDWFDKSDSEIFVGSAVSCRSARDIRIVRSGIVSVAAWMRGGTNYYKNMGR